MCYVYRIFDDRHDAGLALVPEVRRCKLNNPLIIGLPRGGVPLAYEIAMALAAPLDTLVVRKLGAPSQPELAVGAIASGGIRVLNDEVVSRIFGLDESVLDEITARESVELKRRERAYRGDEPYPDLAKRDVVLVDDGMATGATMRAAAEAVRSRGPARIIVAVPAGSQNAVDDISNRVDHVICLQSPGGFSSVGQFYRVFAQTSDEEVRELLDKARDSERLRS